MHTLDLRNLHKDIYSGHLKLGGTSPNGDRINLNNYYLELNGKPWLPVMGEFHFSRFPHEYWEEEILKMKAGGIQIVASYIFWIHHEEEEGSFDWAADNNLRLFAELCAKHGLYFLARIGPFCHGECRNGGLPDWLHGRSFEVRSNEEGYLFHVKRFFEEIGKQLCGLYFKDGGPIIGIQLENEFMVCGAPWETTQKEGTEWVSSGRDGTEHVKLLKHYALESGMDVPIYTSTTWAGSPFLEGHLLPVHGGYVFTPWSPDPNYVQDISDYFIFKDKHSDSYHGASYKVEDYPFACCEIGDGIQITYHHRPIVPPESVEAMSFMYIATGTNLVGYYMYHGGSNPVGKTYTNEFTIPRISYDFQAPIREFGQTVESYRRLNLLHMFLRDFGETLAPMSVALPEGAGETKPTDTETLRYGARTKDGSGFLFLCNYQDHVDELKAHNDVQIELQIDDETITLPRGKGLNLERNVCAILPFNLHLDGVRLKYATTQPLAKIPTDEGDHYFFFAPEGMYSEYAFDKATLANLDAKNSSIEEDAQHIYVRLSPGTASTVTLTSLSGGKVFITTLTRSQVLQSYRANLWGKDRLLISNANLLFDKDTLDVLSLDDEHTSVSVFPAIETVLSADSGVLTNHSEDIFSTFTLEFPKKIIELDIQHPVKNKTILKLPKDLIGGLNDVFLRISYAADIGSAYINGMLISDNFCNGTDWEIGLKRFSEELKNSELVIKLIPLKKGSSAARYVAAGLAFQPGTSEDAISEIRSIEALPEYRATITAS